ncbi:hypothetical protein ACM25O_13285 [Sulfitobacter pontiacus]
MSIPVYLAVTGWRKVVSKLRLAANWLCEFWIIPVFVGIIGLVGWLVYAAVVRDGQEKAWLAAGICQPVTEQLFTPPAELQCVSRSTNGVCTQTIFIPKAAYMRTLVRCEGQSDFWRRSSSIPYGSFGE